MVQINIWERLSLSKKGYAYLRGWKDNEDKLENILLKNSTDAEKKVYKNLKQIDPEIIRKLAISAVDKLDSDDWKIQAYGAGELDEFDEVSCYIGYWVKGMKGIWHPWLYADSEGHTLTEKQHEVWETVMSKLQLCHRDYKLYEKIGKPVFIEFDKGRDYMRKNFSELDILYKDYC